MVVEDKWSGWERGKDLVAVVSGEEARVENHDGTDVGAGADQAPEALFKRDNGFGYAEVVERVATILPDGVAAGFVEGIVYVAKRDFVDDDDTKRFPFYIDALPETVGSEEDGVNVVTKGGEELVRCSVVLLEDRKARRKFVEKGVIYGIKGGVTCKEEQCAAVEKLDKFADDSGGLC